MAIWSALSIISTVLGLVRKAWDRLELLGAYLAGYFKHQKQTEDAEDDEKEDARNARDEMERASRKKRDDILTGDSGSDSVRTDSPVPEDQKPSDNN